MNLNLATFVRIGEVILLKQPPSRQTRNREVSKQKKKKKYGNQF